MTSCHARSAADPTTSENGVGLAAAGVVAAAAGLVEALAGVVAAVEDSVAAAGFLGAGVAVIGPTPRRWRPCEKRCSPRSRT